MMEGRHALAGGRRLERRPRVEGGIAERDDCFDFSRCERRLQPLVAIRLNLRVVQMWQRHVLVEDAVYKRVDHQVALRETQLLDEALHAATGLTRQNSARDRLGLSGVLADDEQACGSVRPSAVEDGPPQRTETVGAAVHRVIGILLTQRPERARWPAIKGITDHGGPPLKSRILGSTDCAAAGGMHARRFA